MGGGIYSVQGLLPALSTMRGGNTQPLIVTKEMDRYRIRRLTENECFKAMGLRQEDCDKCKAVGVSRSQLYRQAGNGIVTNCVALIIEHLYKAQYDSNHKCSDEQILCY